MKYVNIILLILFFNILHAECVDEKLINIGQVKEALNCIELKNTNLDKILLKDQNINKTIKDKQKILYDELEILKNELRILIINQKKYSDKQNNSGNYNKDLIDLKDVVENNRKDLEELTKLSKNRISSFKESCDKTRLIKENKMFRATVEEFSQKNKTINISVLVKNKTKKDIKISRFNKYAILTSPSGEMVYKSTNRDTSVIGAEDSKSFSYNFILKEDYEGNAFDYILRFEHPASNFAFFGITNACFQ